MPNCVICNREVSKGSFSLKDKFELTGGGFICKTCAQKIGIKNFMAAGAYTAQKARKKYFDMYPGEAQGNSTPSAEDEAKLDEQFITQINEIPNCRIILHSELKILRRVLTEGEEVLHAVNCLMGKDSFAMLDSRFNMATSKFSKETWLAALTNSRIILINKHLIVGSDCISLPLEAITSVSYKTGLTESTITIMHGISGPVLENIRKGYEKPFADKANEAIRNLRHGASRPEPQAAPVSAADELAKWHGLLQQGIITQEEFDAQKAKLLR